MEALQLDLSIPPFYFVQPKKKKKKGITNCEKKY